MNRPIIKFIADFGPLLIFFIIYFKGNNDLSAAIPPFIIATIVALLFVYIVEKKISMVPLTSGILITLFGSSSQYINNFYEQTLTNKSILANKILFTHTPLSISSEFISKQFTGFNRIF